MSNVLRIGSREVKLSPRVATILSQIVDDASGFINEAPFGELHVKWGSEGPKVFRHEQVSKRRWISDCGYNQDSNGHRLTL